MAELTRRATALIKEMLIADGKLPAYNEDVVRQALQQVSGHQDGINQMLADAQRVREQQQRQRRRQQQQQDGGGSGEDSSGGGGGEEAAVDWAQSPEHAGAIVVHHETILKLKRILLTYMKMRADCLVAVRWQQRTLRADVRENMSPQEQQFYAEYDRALGKYMSPGDDGIGMDLTLDLVPPKDAHVRVIVVEDHGSIALSHSARVPLVKGSVHNLKCSEAEHLVRMGVLRVLDPNC